jgi:hypothetical protein
MLPEILAAFFLAAVTVALHASGLGLLLRNLLRSHDAPPSGVWPITHLLVSLMWQLILLHLVEILLWALFYWWQKCMPSLESAFYFSGVTYATIGYGDLLLPDGWRLLAPVEGLTGILMCGLSTAFFFAVLSRIYGTYVKNRES